MVWQVKLGEVLRVQGRLSTFANQIQVTVASLREHLTLLKYFPLVLRFVFDPILKMF